MSRAFVKEDSQEEPPRIPPRAHLPEGATNYVTPEGLQQLRDEKRVLEKEKSQLSLDDEAEQRRELALLNGKLNLLNERLGSARKIKPKEQPQNEVRFGATVTLEPAGKSKTQRFQIVGVDQADFKKRKISFLSPIARAVTGSKEGDTVTLDQGRESREFKVLKISY